MSGWSGGRRCRRSGAFPSAPSTPRSCRRRWSSTRRRRARRCRESDTRRRPRRRRRGRRRHGDRADRPAEVLVGHRRPGLAGVDRLEDAAAGRAHPELVGPRRVAGASHRAAAAIRADLSPVKAGERERNRAAQPADLAPTRPQGAAQNETRGTWVSSINGGRELLNNA